MDRERFDIDLVQDEIIAFKKQLLEDVAAEILPLDWVFFEMANFAGQLGYEQGQADLRARLIPVELTSDATGMIQLDGEDAEKLLRDMGISKPKSS